jgi:F-type H+-transporting ATPase subunit delta
MQWSGEEIRAWHMQVDMALIPAISGDFGVMAGHVPIVAQLRPGVVAVHNTLDKDVERYFVSGGFAVAHADSSVEVTVVEAANVEDLDPAAVKTGLAEYTARCYFARFSGAGSSE